MSIPLAQDRGEEPAGTQVRRIWGGCCHQPPLSRAVGIAWPSPLIGVGYGDHRRPDPRIAEVIDRALGDARTVVNVGAGTGSYEPRHRQVTAVEPATVMIEQRAPGAAPVVRGHAEDLPFADRAFDAGMAILTVHHWTDASRGLAELRRVSTRQTVLTWDPAVMAAFWLIDEYLPYRLVTAL